MVVSVYYFLLDVTLNRYVIQKKQLMLSLMSTGIVLMIIPSHIISESLSSGQNLIEEESYIFLSKEFGNFDYAPKNVGLENVIDTITYSSLTYSTSKNNPTATGLTPDSQRMSGEARILVGHFPVGMAINPATGRLYVANYGSNSI